MNITWLTALVGLITGVIGAVLGIVNTWRILSRDKVRLKIHARPAFGSGGEDLHIFEIVNLSDFPVSISEAGYLLSNGGKIPLAFINGRESPQRMPCKLEPRTAYTKVIFYDLLSEHADSGTKTYARTVCGKTAYGKLQFMSSTSPSATSATVEAENQNNKA